MTNKNNTMPQRMSDGRTPEQYIFELGNFFRESEKYYMDPLRLIELLDIVRDRMMAEMSRPRMERCPFAGIDKSGAIIHCE